MEGLVRASSARPSAARVASLGTTPLYRSRQEDSATPESQEVVPGWRQEQYSQWPFAMARSAWRFSSSQPAGETTAAALPATGGKMPVLAPDSLQASITACAIVRLCSGPFEQPGVDRELRVGLRSRPGGGIVPLPQYAAYYALRYRADGDFLYDREGLVVDDHRGIVACDRHV